MKTILFIIGATLPATAAPCNNLTIDSPATAATFTSNRAIVSVCVPASVQRLQISVTVPDSKDPTKTITVYQSGPHRLDRGVDRWSPEVFLADGQNTITVTDAANPSSSANITVTGSGSDDRSDTRERFEADFYVGASIDSFASNNTKQYIGYKSTDAGPQTGFVAGIDFAYRLSARRKIESRWPLQLWVYGETVHGQRSAEVNCSGGTNASPLCSDFSPANAANQFLAVLRNATSLEGFSGLRLELFKLNQNDKNSANLYVKSQFGFLTVQGNGADIVDDHTKLAVGAIMTNGSFRDSYLETGWGKTDLFATHPGRRFKVDGYVQWKVPVSQKVSMYPFFQLTVDSDFGPGADDVRTFYGINMDIRELGCLFAGKKCAP